MTDPLVLSGDGVSITSRVARDVIGDALTLRAQTVVIPVERLEPAFFDLRTGVAGDIVQAFVTYQLRLVVVGPLPPVAVASRAFGAFVAEANRGTQLRFVETLAEAERRKPAVP